ncbi:MAG: GTPase ObgE [Candidatus Eiseniibacteriota bacterium]
MFADRATIRVEAGKGGAGAISFRREKYVPKGGPDGGDGGRGGSVIFLVDPNVKTLLDFQADKIFRAGHGGFGSGKTSTGKDGKDKVIKIPPGTLVRDSDTGDELVDLVEPGARWVAAKGGQGGRGNARFKTSTNQAPRRADPGIPGEARNLSLELKLVADCGLVGFPNAGKSTLISALSSARPKIADYPFTTLRPVLGVVRLDEERHFVLEDIPGLIEGASEGKGLGHEFLRHIERTRVLAFVIDVTTEDPRSALATLERELRAWSPALLEKPRLIVLSKADLVTAEVAAERARAMDALVISAVTGSGLEEFRRRVWAALDAASVGGQS